MFTQEEKKMLLYALVAWKSGIERSKSKARSPKLAGVYEEELEFVAALTMKVQALEVNDGKGKVASR